MLAGCSSTVLSPRHRLRSEASSQFQSYHIPVMSTQRLELPCSFTRKDVSSITESGRSVAVSIEKSVDAKGLRHEQNIKLLPVVSRKKKKHKNEDEFWEQRRSFRKRQAGEVSYEEETCPKRVHRQSFGVDGGFNLPLSFPCLPFSPLSNVTGVTGLGRGVENTGKSKDTSASSSSTTSSSGSKNSIFELDHEWGNVKSGQGSKLAVATEENGRNRYIEDDCIELLSLLVMCTEQIASKNVAAISHCLARLGELASPRGISAVHRLSAYYTEGLALRVAQQWPVIFEITARREFDPVEDCSTALRLLNQITPVMKFIHFTSNEILLRAFEAKDRIHIIDFEVKQGLQWPSLFQSLASRQGPPSHIRITGVGESKQELVETGELLSGFAEALSLPFEFHPVVIDQLEDVRLWMLHVKENESIAVNCVFQLHKMINNSRKLLDFLDLIHSTNAEAVIIAEQEAAHNEISLDSRLVNSLKYYSAIFDSIDCSLPLESKIRIKIEQFYGREIRNIIACEGEDRLERHEEFAKWRHWMEQAGFKSLGISQRELSLAKMILKMYPHQDKYKLEKQEIVDSDTSCLTLSWIDRPLYSISAWTSISSSSESDLQHTFHYSKEF